MKIARYLYDNKETYGVLNNDSVLSLPALAEENKEQLPENIESFIAAGENALRTAENLLLKVKSEQLTALNESTLLAPLAQPPKIICLGLNYRDHAKETAATLPKEPIIFMKPRTALIGPNGKINKSFVRELDYEGELAIIIGAKSKNVPISEAKSCVFGYTVFNDVSAREIQFGDKQWTRGNLP